MPTIINAYGANDSIANSLAKLGESMFGNGARDEAARQQAKSVEQDVAKKSRENAFTPLIASRIASHDYDGALSAGVNAGMNPAHLGGYQQYYDVNKSGPASDLGLRATMSVPGASYGNTVPGTREHEASAEGIAAGHDATTLKANDMTTSRVMQQAQWADQHTLVPLQSPDGTRIINVPRSEVQAFQSQGYQVAPSMDQTKAQATRMLMPQIGAPAGAPGPQSAAPPMGLEQRNDLKHIAGFPALPQTEVADLARADSIRNSVANEPPIDTTKWDQSPLAHDVRATSGLGTLVPHSGEEGWSPGLAIGHSLSQATIPGVIARVLGASGQMTPEITNADNRLEQLAARVKTAHSSYDATRPTNYTEKIVGSTFPHHGVLTPSSDAMASVGPFVASLKEKEQVLRQAIANPNVPHAELDKLHAAFRENQALLREVMGPPQVPPMAAPAPQAAAPAPQGAPAPVQQAQQPQPAAPQQAWGPPKPAIQALRQNPGLSAQFDVKYGQGASARVLGGQ